MLFELVERWNAAAVPQRTSALMITGKRMVLRLLLSLMDVWLGSRDKYELTNCFPRMFVGALTKAIA